METRRPLRDDDTFTHVYRRHHRALRAYATRLVGERDAEDVVTETFIVALRALAKIPDNRQEPWLRGVARNIVRTQRRGRARADKYLQLLTPIQQTTTIPLADGRLSVEELDLIRHVLHRLRADDRAILELSIGGEWSPSELAHVLGISAVAARVRLHRARARFIAAAETLGGIGEHGSKRR